MARAPSPCSWAPGSWREAECGQDLSRLGPGEAQSVARSEGPPQGEKTQGHGEGPSSRASMNRPPSRAGRAQPRALGRGRGKWSEAYSHALVSQTLGPQAPSADGCQRK